MDNLLCLTVQLELTGINIFRINHIHHEGHEEFEDNKY